MDIGQTQCIVRILALLLERQRTIFDTQVPFKACGPLIFNIIFHAYYNPGHPFLKMKDLSNEQWHKLWRIY